MDLQDENWNVEPLHDACMRLKRDMTLPAPSCHSVYPQERPPERRQLEEIVIALLCVLYEYGIAGRGEVGG